MNKLALVVSLVPVCAALAAKPDPQALPAYAQQVRATFATPEAAAVATLAVAPLPEGAARAFATRWDDTAPRHIAKAAMLEKVGVKGNFYFVGKLTDFSKPFNEKDFAVAGARELVRRGHAVGNHTLTHPFMLQLSANAAYNEILLNRIALELVLGRTVMSYASPFGWYGSGPVFDSLGRRRLVADLVRTGHWVSGDNPLDDAQMPEEEWMPANRFSADDRNPSAELFAKGYAAQVAAAARRPLSPRITLGTHSWCDDAGNARQAEWLARDCVKSDWVQLNDYEYGAYRYAALNAGIGKMSVKGNVATFCVMRFEPTALGDARPLSLVFSERPTSVVASGGLTLTEGRNDTWLLPQGPNHAAAFAAVKFAEQAGVQLVLRPDEKKNALAVEFVNGSRAALTDVHVTVLLPPGCARRREIWLPDGKVAAGRTCRTAYALDRAPGAPCRTADFDAGTALYAAFADFTTAAGRVRLWATARTEIVRDFPTPNATGRWAGPFAEGAFTADDLAALSAAEGPLPAKLGTADAAWQASANARSRWWNLTPPSRSRGKNLGGVYVAAFQFEAAVGKVPRLISNASRIKGMQVFVNGRPLAKLAEETALDVRAGLNRVVFAYPDGQSYLQCLQAFVAEDPDAPAWPCKAFP